MEDGVMDELLPRVIENLRDSAWGGLAAVVAASGLFITVGGIPAKMVRAIRRSPESDLTRDEFKLLKAFNEQFEEHALGNPKMPLLVEHVAQ
jgi:hypothetical protein